MNRANRINGFQDENPLSNGMPHRETGVDALPMSGVIIAGIFSCGVGYVFFWLVTLCFSYVAWFFFHPFFFVAQTLNVYPAWVIGVFFVPWIAAWVFDPVTGRRAITPLSNLLFLVYVLMAVGDILTWFY